MFRDSTSLCEFTFVNKPETTSLHGSHLHTVGVSAAGEARPAHPVLTPLVPHGRQGADIHHLQQGGPLL